MHTRNCAASIMQKPAAMRCRNTIAKWQIVSTLNIAFECTHVQYTHIHAATSLILLRQADTAARRPAPGHLYMPAHLVRAQMRLPRRWLRHQLLLAARRHLLMRLLRLTAPHPRPDSPARLPSPRHMPRPWDPPMSMQLPKQLHTPQAVSQTPPLSPQSLLFKALLC